MEFEPFRQRDCLVIVDAIRKVFEAHTTPDGCLSPHGMKVSRALLDGLEFKLNGPRRGPQVVPGPREG